MADGSLTAAIDTVTGTWAADGALAAQTLDKFGLLLGRFTGSSGKRPKSG